MSHVFSVPFELAKWLRKKSRAYQRRKQRVKPNMVIRGTEPAAKQRSRRLLRSQTVGCFRNDVIATADRSYSNTAPGKHGVFSSADTQEPGEPFQEVDAKTVLQAWQEQKTSTPLSGKQPGFTPSPKLRKRLSRPGIRVDKVDQISVANEDMDPRTVSPARLTEGRQGGVTYQTPLNRPKPDLTAVCYRPRSKERRAPFQLKRVTETYNSTHYITGETIFENQTEVSENCPDKENIPRSAWEIPCQNDDIAGNPACSSDKAVRSVHIASDFGVAFEGRSSKTSNGQTTLSLQNRHNSPGRGQGTSPTRRHPSSSHNTGSRHSSPPGSRHTSPRRSHYTSPPRNPHTSPRRSHDASPPRSHHTSPARDHHTSSPRDHHTVAPRIHHTSPRRSHRASPHRNHYISPSRSHHTSSLRSQHSSAPRSRHTSPPGNHHTSPARSHHTSPPRNHRTSPARSHHTSPPRNHHTSPPRSHRTSPGRSHPTSSPRSHHTSSPRSHHTSSPRSHHTSPDRNHHTSPPRSHRTSPRRGHHTAAPRNHHTSPPRSHRTSPCRSHRTSSPRSHHTSSPRSHRTSPCRSHRTSSPRSHHTSSPRSHHTSPPKSHHTSPPKSHHTTPGKNHRTSPHRGHRWTESSTLSVNCNHPSPMGSRHTSPEGGHRLARHRSQSSSPCREAHHLSRSSHHNAPVRKPRRASTSSHRSTSTSRASSPDSRPSRANLGLPFVGAWAARRRSPSPRSQGSMSASWYSPGSSRAPSRDRSSGEEWEGSELASPALSARRSRSHVRRRDSFSGFKPQHINLATMYRRIVYPKIPDVQPGFEPLIRFRRAVKSVQVLLKATERSRHTAQITTPSTVSWVQIHNDLEASKSARAERGLLFDPSDYRAKRELQLSSEAKAILSMEPAARTPEQMHVALVSLNQSVEAFSEFPIKMQESLVRVGYYEHFEANRVIIRQGHFADNFYLILTGLAVVTILETDKHSGESSVRTAAFLKKGNSFGVFSWAIAQYYMSVTLFDWLRETHLQNMDATIEFVILIQKPNFNLDELALMHGALRSATVTCKDSVELLAVGRQDFIDVFMHVEKDREPDHIQYLRSIDAFRGWPVDKLPYDNPKVCLFTYFRKGVLLCRDSITSDWVYVIKTGACKVLKEVTCPKSESDKNKKHEKAWTSIHLPKSRNDSGHHGTPNGKQLNKGNTRGKQTKSKRKLPLVRDRGHNELQESSEEHLEQLIKIYSNIHPDVEADTTGINMAYDDLKVGPTEAGTSPKSQCSQSGGRYDGNEDADVNSADTSLDPNLQNPSTGNSGLSTEPTEPSRTETEPGPRSASSEPSSVFVQVARLVPKDVFGLEHPILSAFAPSTSMSLVSDGAECILVNRKFFMEHLSDTDLKRLRLSMQPYPTKQDLQRKLQDKQNWNNYKALALQSHLDFTRHVQETLSLHY